VIEQVLLHCTHAGRSAVSAEMQRTGRSEQLRRLWGGTASHLFDGKMCQRVRWVLAVNSL